MISKLEKAKTALHIAKLQTIVQEKQFKIMEREVDIERIANEILELLKNINELNEKSKE